MWLNETCDWSRSLFMRSMAIVIDSSLLELKFSPLSRESLMKFSSFCRSSLRLTRSIVGCLRLSFRWISCSISSRRNDCFPLMISMFLVLYSSW